MKCPHCAHDKIRVIDTVHPNGNFIRRRRTCKGCNREFTTIEEVSGDVGEIAVRRRERQVMAREMKEEATQALQGQLAGSPCLYCGEQKPPVDVVDASGHAWHAECAQRLLGEYAAAVAAKRRGLRVQLVRGRFVIAEF